MNPLVYIVVLNWNGYEDTCELIDSLSRITYPNYKILVVDNNSSNDDVIKLKMRYGTNIQLYECHSNLGYAGGNNKGIEVSLKENADFVTIINNDTIVEDDFLDILISKFMSHENVGIVAPQINYYAQRNRIWSSGGTISSIRGSGFAESDKWEKNVNGKDKMVSFVSGCCMLVKRNVFEKIGLFDEDYFLYNEDTDFCWRTLQSGHNILLARKSKIYHKVSVSTKRTVSELPLYYTTRNRLLFAKKNLKLFFPFTFFYVLFSMLIKSIIWLIKGNKSNVKIVFLSIKDFALGKVGKSELK